MPLTAPAPAPWTTDLHRHGGGPGLDVTIAFQPVVDLDTRSVYAYEALVRGRGGASAAEVLAKVPAAGRYAFDQVCRIAAVALAARLGLTASLSVNFLPNALYEADTTANARGWGSCVNLRAVPHRSTTWAVVSFPV